MSNDAFPVAAAPCSICKLPIDQCRVVGYPPYPVDEIMTQWMPGVLVGIHPLDRLRPAPDPNIAWAPGRLP